MKLENQFNLGPADTFLARQIPYWRFFRLRSLALTGFVVLGLAAIAADIAGIGLIIPLLSLIDGAASGSNSEVLNNVPIIKSATQWMVSLPPQQRLFTIAGLIATIGLLKACIGFSKTFLYNWTFTQLSRDLHRKCYERFLTMPVADVLLGDTSIFTNMIVSFPRESATAVLSVAQMVISLISGTVILALILLVSLEIGLTAIVLSGTIAVIVWALLIRPISSLGGEINDRGVKFYGWIIESVRGRVAIDGLGMHEAATRRLNDLAGSFISFTLYRERLRALVDPSLAFLSSLLVAGLFAAAAQDPANISARLSETIVLILCLTRLLGPMTTMNVALTDFQTYRNSIDRVTNFLDWRPNFQDEGLVYPGMQQSIEFKSVSFCYAERSDPALDDVSFSLKKNSMVALVGRSGAGKTTIVSLVMRFFETTQGGIFVDGGSITSFTRASWRKKISYVPQDSFLFDDTVENNIRAGYDASLEDVVEAARKAHALDFISEMPFGFSTNVGENGVRLSGGQKQRIAIARAVLRQPDLLILDEATSNLDGVSEHAIRKSLSDLRQTCAVLVVAHRISTIVDADMILVMDGGRIIERGTHAELLASGRLYRQMLELQTVDALES